MNRSVYAGLIASTLTLGITLSAHAKLTAQGGSSVEFKATGHMGLSVKPEVDVAVKFNAIDQ
jgi:hypothetical protein